MHDHDAYEMLLNLARQMEILKSVVKKSAPEHVYKKYMNLYRDNMNAYYRIWEKIKDDNNFKKGGLTMVGEDE